jgi:hypothetical protein
MFSEIALRIALSSFQAQLIIDLFIIEREVTSTSTMYCLRTRYYTLRFCNQQLKLSFMQTQKLFNKFS